EKEQKNNEQKNNEQKNNEQKNNEQNNNEQSNNEQNNNENKLEKKPKKFEEILFEHHIPFSELQLRKAQNIHELFTRIGIEEGKIGKIKTKYATIIFALCKQDVDYVVKKYYKLKDKNEDRRECVEIRKLIQKFIH